MSTSQYADGNVKDKSGVDITVAILTGAFFVVLAMVTSRGNAFITSELPGPLAIAIIAAVTVLSGLLKLGGMNGDVSGHMITVSEMCGVAALALLN